MCLSQVSQTHRGSPGPVFHVLMNGPNCYTLGPNEKLGSHCSCCFRLRCPPRHSWRTEDHVLSVLSASGSLPSSSFLLHLLQLRPHHSDSYNSLQMMSLHWTSPRSLAPCSLGRVLLEHSSGICCSSTPARHYVHQHPIELQGPCQVAQQRELNTEDQLQWYRMS